MTKFTSQHARDLINTYGFSIFPLHGMNDGKCTCGTQCTSPGKHPYTSNGFQSATNDIEIVKQLWNKDLPLNCGIATGKPSNIVVIDIDNPEAEENLKKLITLPETLTVKTGRGKHLYFKYNPEKPLRNKTNIIPKVDIRGDGGYVVAPYSLHQNGNVYEFINPLEIIAPLPEDIYNLINKEQPKQTYSLLNYKNNDSFSKDQIEDMLQYIDPDADYLDWVNVGMALNDAGIPFAVFDSWSSKGSKYPGAKELQKKWNSFSPGKGVSIGTIYYHATQRGYSPSQNKIQSKEVYNPKQHVSEVIDKETGEITEAKKQKFFYINAPDVVFNPDTQDFVQGTLTKGAMSVVYGESNCGKTFFMSDLAFHIVQGKEWNGKRVEKGNVLYICMEGAFGLKNRIVAYRKHTGQTLNGFLMMPCSVDFTAENDNDINELISLLENAKGQLGDISLIVIDTLARAVAGGDENSGQDMGMLVRKSDIIRAYTGAHVCFIHHSGKDKARGARGHSSLRAAVDTEIEISRSEGSDYSSAKVAKQRDMERGEDLYFKLKTIDLGKNRHGESVTSCVVEPYDLQNDLKERIHKKIKSGKTKVAFDALIECIGDKGMVKNSPDLPKTKIVLENQFIEYLTKRGVLSDNPKSAKIQYSRIRIDLIENELLNYRDGYLWPKG